MGAGAHEVATARYSQRPTTRDKKVQITKFGNDHHFHCDRKRNGLDVSRFTILIFMVLVSVTAVLQRASAENAPEYASLAVKFAPQIMYEQAEPNLPTSVDWFLSRTTLSVHDAGCSPQDVLLGKATVSLLQDSVYTSPCGGRIIRASGTRSASRDHTFVLSDVSDGDKLGSKVTSDWPVYLHAFKNMLGGWTIQYWCFYAFNTGQTVLGVEIGYHGGDWEMFQVDTDSNGNPKSVAVTGHQHVESAPWSSVSVTDISHPIIYAERGGHEMHINPKGPPPYIRRGTWPDSTVVGILSGEQTKTYPAGPIIDLGSRLHPFVGFVRYSGLWGSLGQTPWSSGYWGPAFNETDMPPDSFLFAWCFNMKDARTIQEDGRRECYPDDIQ